MKDQYNWIMKRLPKLPSFDIRDYVHGRRECDDEFIMYEGGKVDNEAAHGHTHGPSAKDVDLFNKSMFKLKLVSSVSIFFIIA